MLGQHVSLIRQERMMIKPSFISLNISPVDSESVCNVEVYIYSEQGYLIGSDHYLYHDNEVLLVNCLLLMMI